MKLDRPLTLTEKALLYIMGILCVLFIFIVVNGFVVEYEDAHEPKTTTEKETTEEYVDIEWTENYEGDYPGIGDAVAINMSDDENFDLMLKVNSVQKSDTFDKKFNVDANLMNELSNYKSGKEVSCYESEIRYVYINFSIKNISDKDSEFNFIDTGIVNYYNEEWHRITGVGKYIFTHIKTTDNETESKVSRCESSRIKAGEVKNYTMVCLFGPVKIYDLYLSVSQFATDLNQKIHLDIKLEEMFIDETEDGKLGDYPKRIYKQGKIASGVLNYNIFLQQKEGIFCDEGYLGKAGTIIEPYFEITNPEEHRYKSNLGLEISDVGVCDDMESLPKEFKDSTYLKDMLDVYLKELPYKKEEYRFLFLKGKISQTARMGGQENLSEYFWLYNRDKEGRLWYLGHPDDFYITDYPEDKEVIYGSDYLRMDPYDTATVVAAYVIVPDTLYDVYILNIDDELKEGEKDYEEVPEDGLLRGISLGIKYLEEGGIK